MKHYLSMLPLIFYPYLYMVVLALAIALPDQSYGEYSSILFLVATVVCNLYTLCAIIYNIVCASKGIYSARHLAKLNMLAKFIQIPAYCFHFVLGMIGSLASVWGIGFVMWAIFIDVLTIVVSGTNGISAVVGCYKDGIFSKKSSIVFGILNYIFCIDVIAAIILFVRSKVQFHD